MSPTLPLPVWREQHPKGDPAFDTLLRAMQGDKKAKVTKLPHPTALDIAMLNAAKLPVPEDAMDTRDPAILAAIARNAATPIEERLAVGERPTAFRPEEHTSDTQSLMPL